MKKTLIPVIIFMLSFCGNAFCADELTHTIKNNMIQIGGTTDVANSPVVEQSVIILGVTWSGTIAVGEKISLEDSDGNHFCNMECTVENAPMKEYFLRGYKVKGGIYSDDFDSGSVRIQLK